jgi:hypothetical protein
VAGGQGPAKTWLWRGRVQAVPGAQQAGPIRQQNPGAVKATTPAQ